MKQQIIEPKKKLLLVEEENKGFLCKVNFLDTIFGKAKKVGKLTDIKEEQFKELVKENDELSLAGCGFEDYDGTSICDTAKESFFSKLEKDGIAFANPIKKPSATDHSGMKNLNEKLDRYYEAEKKVFDINRCWLFEII